MKRDIRAALLAPTTYPRPLQEYERTDLPLRVKIEAWLKVHEKCDKSCAYYKETKAARLLLNFGIPEAIDALKEG